MTKIKTVATVVAMIGIVGMSVGGATNPEISALVPIGIGVGTALSAIIAIFKK